MEQAQQNPNTTDMITPEQPPETAKLLDSLPGMIGAIDQAVLETSGKRFPFVLLVFAGGGALHATNMIPASGAVSAIRQLAAQWDTHDPEAHHAAG